MHLIRLLRSRVFQLSLLSSAIFGIAAFAVVATLYYSSLQAVTRQIEATIDAEIKGLAEQYRQFGSIGLIRAVQRRARERSRPGALYLVVDARFTPLAGNIAVWPKEEPDAGGWVAFPFRGDAATGRRVNAGEGAGDAVRGEARGRMFRLRGGIFLLVAHDLREQQRVSARTRETLILAGLVAVLFAIASGGLLSWLVLRRIDSINRTSREIMAGDLARRVPETGRGDEFDRLAQSLNAMLAQNEKLFQGMREVGENLAHDLRSPLGRVRQRLERQLSDALSAREKQALSVEALEETDRLLSTFNAILSIAQAESGAPKRSFQPVDLRTLLQDVADLYEPLVEDAGATLALALPDRRATVRGNRDMLFSGLRQPAGQRHRIRHCVRRSGSGGDRPQPRYGRRQRAPFGPRPRRRPEGRSAGAGARTLLPGRPEPDDRRQRPRPGAGRCGGAVARRGLEPGRRRTGSARHGDAASRQTRGGRGNTGRNARRPPARPAQRTTDRGTRVMVILYGLKTCDTCRAARRYLEERAFLYEFRDLRADGFSDAELDAWIAAAGWETLLNKSSRTWRDLPEADRAGLDAGKAGRC